MRRRLFLARGVLVLASLSPAISDAAQTHSAGTLRFQVTVSGQVHDSGTITAPIDTLSGGTDFNGCAIVTQQATAKRLGAQTFEIHVNYRGGVNLLAVGTPPSANQEIYLQIADYRPGVLSYGKGGTTPVTLSFAIRGRAYGTPGVATAHLQNGGREGTISGRDGLRLYPATIGHPLHGVSFQAQWQCTSVLHVTAPF